MIIGNPTGQMLRCRGAFNVHHVASTCFARVLQDLAVVPRMSTTEDPLDVLIERERAPSGPYPQGGGSAG